MYNNSKKISGGRKAVSIQYVFSKFLGLALFAWFSLSLSAGAVNYADWSSARASWQRGYILGMIEGVIKVVRHDEVSEDYRRSLHSCVVEQGFSDNDLLNFVHNYVQRNPETVTMDMVLTVTRTVHEVCASYQKGNNGG